MKQIVDAEGRDASNGGGYGSGSKADADDPAFINSGETDNRVNVTAARPGCPGTQNVSGARCR
jgi:hypothetical protein